MITPTSISSFLYCPRKLFLEKVFKLVKYPRDAMIKGTVKHEIFEQINNNDKRIVTDITEIDLERVLLSYKKEYSIIVRQSIMKNIKKLREYKIDELEFFNNIWKIISYEAESKANSVFKFAKKFSLTGADLWNNLTPKITCELRLEDKKLDLRGIIDELRDYKNEFVPVELKSGKAPVSGVWPGHKAQIAAYMIMLKNKGDIVKEGIIKYIDDRKEVIIPYNVLLEEQIINQIDETKAIINSKEVPKHIDNRNKCNACQLKEECYNYKFIEQRAKGLNMTKAT